MATVWLTEAELQTRFGETRVNNFADRDGDGTADSGVIEAAILRAESRARARLLTRYQPADLPTATGDASLLLKEIVGGFAIWNLTDHCEIRGDDIVQAERSANAMLTDVVRAEASLLLASEPAKDLSAPQILEAKRTSVHGSAYPIAPGGCDKGSLSKSIEDW